MLEAPATDDRARGHRVLVLTAFVCCGLVLASFALFARDQLAGASEHQQTELVTGGASQPVIVRPHVRA